MKKLRLFLSFVFSMIGFASFIISYLLDKKYVTEAFEVGLKNIMKKETA